MKQSLFSKLKNSLTSSQQVVNSIEPFKDNSDRFRKQILLTDSIYQHEHPFEDDSVEFSFEKKPSKFKKVRQKVQSKERSHSLSDKSHNDNYYRNQLIKIKTENINLRNRVEELEKLLQIRNTKIDQLSLKLEKMHEQLAQCQEQEIKYTQILRQVNPQKQTQIQQLRKEVEHFQSQYLKVKDENYEIRNKYAQLLHKYTEQYQKSFKLTPSIRHLWEVKQVQFQHIFNQFKQIKQS